MSSRLTTAINVYKPTAQDAAPRRAMGGRLGLTSSLTPTSVDPGGLNYDISFGLINRLTALIIEHESLRLVFEQSKT